ncbi:MAG: ribonuclease H-like domain-containing protein [Verrucomicrobia bacterium]|nr:ribonuclease H-like domain-containing protein [Verrucomicrobiota bacterium]
MIRGALQHLPGVGRERLRLLQNAGITDWRQLAEDVPLSGIGPVTQKKLQAEVLRCEAALAEGNIRYLVSGIRKSDQWRVLGHFFDHASYFDIETSGLDIDSRITVICCLHRGKLYTFTKNENLDEFVDLLDDVDLLVSFNGASFDVPRVVSEFHIPELPCPHIDLRWLCYYESLRGGLKTVEKSMGIERPTDLVGVDGEEAVWLWEMWERGGNGKARERLLRYCAADVLSLRLLAGTLLECRGYTLDFPRGGAVWRELLSISSSTPKPVVKPSLREATDKAQERLRSHWVRRRTMERRDRGTM